VSITSPSRAGTPQDAPELVAIRESDGLGLAPATVEEEGVAEPVDDVDVESPGATSIFSPLEVLDEALSWVVEDGFRIAVLETTISARATCVEEGASDMDEAEDIGMDALVESTAVVGASLAAEVAPAEFDAGSAVTVTVTVCVWTPPAVPSTRAVVFCAGRHIMCTLFPLVLLL
jgi:hypothetical protein